MGNVALAFILTALAGLSTGIGSAIAFFTRRTGKRFLSFTLGLSAGVMIYVSLVEMLPKAVDFFAPHFGVQLSNAAAAAGFFGGMLLIALIDTLVPSGQAVECSQLSADTTQDKARLMRTGTLTALAIGIHNFPEGMATFVSAMQSPSFALPIVCAIAIHNIPEGIAVSVPIHCATGSRRKAFFWSFLSGITEPLGALIGYLILLPFMNDIMYGIMFSAVSGIMVFISIDELLPTAQSFGQHRLSVFGMVLGMAIMAVSLIMFM